MKTALKLLREANWMKKAAGDLYPLWELAGSLDIVCDTVEALVTDERTHEILDEIGITENEYEDARKELDVIADILCLEALELDP
ncbi:MAG: hypothetical protein LM558_01010 [Thermosphaera sp.]|nr:hypothetical protein [Thermosphaera sp.]